MPDRGELSDARSDERNEPSGQGLPADPEGGTAAGGATRRRGRKSVHWRRDPLILERLREVERLRLRGVLNVEIARQLKVDEGTVRHDLVRLAELWRERTAGTQEQLRAEKLRELEDIKRRALKAADFDLQAERAVLFDEYIATPDEEGEDVLRKVHRDDKGSITFKGNKSGSLNVARQAVMDAAKLLGLVEDRQKVTVEVERELAGALDRLESELEPEVYARVLGIIAARDTSQGATDRRR